MVMVTHDAHAAAIADRVLFLADGLIVEELPRSGATEILAAMSRAGCMIRVALAGLLGRKLRTALTAIAIVLGVAMVSGTFVLTDSIDKAFNSIFTERPPGLRRRHQRQGRDEHRTSGSLRADARRVAARQGARRCPTSPPPRAASAARRS